MRTSCEHGLACSFPLAALPSSFSSCSFLFMLGSSHLCGHPTKLPLELIFDDHRTAWYSLLILPLLTHPCMPFTLKGGESFYTISVTSSVLLHLQENLITNCIVSFNHMDSALKLYQTYASEQKCFCVFVVLFFAFAFVSKYLNVPRFLDFEYL